MFDPANEIKFIEPLTDFIENQFENQSPTKQKLGCAGLFNTSMTSIYNWINAGDISVIYHKNGRFEAVRSIGRSAKPKK